MTETIDFDFSELTAFLETLEQGTDIAAEEAAHTMQASINAFEAAVVQFTPVGATGHLRACIAGQMFRGLGLNMQGEVFTGVIMLTDILLPYQWQFQFNAGLQDNLQQ